MDPRWSSNLPPPIQLPSSTNSNIALSSKSRNRCGMLYQITRYRLAMGRSTPTQSLGRSQTPSTPLLHPLHATHSFTLLPFSEPPSNLFGSGGTYLNHLFSDRTLPVFSRVGNESLWCGVCVKIQDLLEISNNIFDISNDKLSSFIRKIK